MVLADILSYIDFELKDGSSDWSDEILNNNQILTQECEVVNEQETE